MINLKSVSNQVIISTRKNQAWFNKSYHNNKLWLKLERSCLRSDSRYVITYDFVIVMPRYKRLEKLNCNTNNLYMLKYKMPQYVVGKFFKL